MILPEEKERLLSEVDLFEALSREQVRKLCLMLPVVGLRRGQLLHGPGHRGEIFHLLLRGRLRLYKVFGRGEATLYFVNSGDVFGEEAFRSGHGRQGMYAQAVEDSEIALMRVDAFERLARDEPEVGFKMVELLSDRISFYTERVADADLKDVTGRLASLILHLAESEGLMTQDGGYRIPVRYTHQQLGEMIGAKRVAVTRALGNLRGAGVVTLEHRNLHVNDVQTLERTAGR